MNRDNEKNRDEMINERNISFQILRAEFRVKKCRRLKIRIEIYYEIYFLYLKKRNHKKKNKNIFYIIC